MEWLSACYLLWKNFVLLFSYFKIFSYAVFRILRHKVISYKKFNDFVFLFNNVWKINWRSWWNVHTRRKQKCKTRDRQTDSQTERERERERCEEKYINCGDFVHRCRLRNSFKYSILVERNATKRRIKTMAKNKWQTKWEWRQLEIDWMQVTYRSRISSMFCDNNKTMRWMLNAHSYNEQQLFIWMQRTKQFPLEFGKQQKRIVQHCTLHDAIGRLKCKFHSLDSGLLSIQAMDRIFDDSFLLFFQDIRNQFSIRQHEAQNNEKKSTWIV